MWNRFGAVAEVLSSELFRRLLNSDCIKINELNAAVVALIEAGIDFSIIFEAGTTGTRPVATLTIAVTPTTNITIEFLFECY